MLLVHDEAMRDELRWLLALADEENITAAAARLHVSQPTLSRRLQRLERDLGRPLFARVGRRIELTDAGARFVAHVRRADAELVAAEQELHDQGPVTVGLGFLHSFGSWLVPPLVARAREVEPRLRFRLVQDAADVIAGRVADGSLDLGIVSPRPGIRSLTWRRLTRQRVGAALPTGHRLADRERLRMADLSEETFVAMAAGYGVRQLFDEMCAAAGFTPSIGFECQELDTVAGLVASGAGVGLLPLEDSPRLPPGLTLVPLADSGAGRDIGLIWRRSAPLTPELRLVREVATDLTDAGAGLGAAEADVRGRTRGR